MVLCKDMKINHKTLAVISGFALVAIVIFNIFSSREENEIREIDKVRDEKSLINITPTEPEVLIEETPRYTEVYEMTIDLSGKGLTEVPALTFTRSNIEVLDVSNNNVQGSLQAEIRNMTSLKVLDLSDNMFTGVPAEVGQLSQLEYLDLSNNSITGLPYEIGNLKNLKRLDLRGNKYSEQDLAIIRENLPTTVEILID